MKKMIMAVALMFGVTSFAQKIVAGSLESLKNESKLNLEVDYSEAVIHGMGVKEFAEYEQDWEKDQPEIVGDIIEGIQDKIGDDYIIGKIESANYTLLIILQLIDTKGNMVANVKVKDKSGNVVCEIVKLKGEGGVFGTKLNLIKDGASNIGERLGKFLRNEFRSMK